jgi:hypothetical protein
MPGFAGNNKNNIGKNALILPGGHPDAGGRSCRREPQTAESAFAKKNCRNSGLPDSEISPIK